MVVLRIEAWREEVGSGCKVAHEEVLVDAVEMPPVDRDASDVGLELFVFALEGGLAEVEEVGAAAGHVALIRPPEQFVEVGGEHVRAVRVSDPVLFRLHEQACRAAP